MIGAFLGMAALLLLLAEEVRWYELDLADEATTIASVTAAQAKARAQEQGWSFSLESLPPGARPIGYAGEERGLLWTLLSLRVAESSTDASPAWLASPELKFRVAGLATHIAGEKDFSRALLAPLPGKRWLLGIASPASIDEEKLRRNFKNPAVRQTLQARLQNLLRDGHAARNAGKKTPYRLGYPKLGSQSLLEIGDLESEASFSASTRGKAMRWIEKRSDGVRREETIDDGIVLPPGSSLHWTLDLQSLISDDLILFARSGHDAARGEIFVDGVPLARWEPQATCASDFAGQWFECAARIPNRLLAGKERAQIELRPDPQATISAFRIEFLRLPPPHGDYLAAGDAKKGPAHASSNRAVSGCPLIVGGYRFFHGLGTVAPSELAYETLPSWKELEAFVGVDDSSPNEGPVAFRITVDGEMRAQSKPLKKGDAPQTLRASVEGAREIRLLVLPKDPAETRRIHANWLEIRAIP